MELKIKPKKQDNNTIENIAILYYISAIMVIFFEINNFKVILEIHDFYNYIELFFLNIILFLSFLKAGHNNINLDYNKYNIKYYSILSAFQFVKPIIIFYIYYNYVLQYNNLKLNVSLLFNMYSIILNIASIKLIVRYKKILATIESN
jgi:hypothetical protein